MNFSSFDLDAYANKYIGYTRVKRLNFIAEHEESLQLHAYRLALDELKTGINMQLYSEISHIVGDRLGDKYVFDETFCENTKRNAAQKLLRLEQELSSYKTNLIKESIRMGHNDLGEFYCRKGDLSSALKSYVRTRDFCTTNKHIIDMCLNVIKIGVHSENYVHVSNYCIKAEQCLSNVESNARTLSKLACCYGLSHLNGERYRQVATHFLGCDIELGSTFNEVIHAEDVAVYGTLCAMASMNRSELKIEVIDNQSFKNFLELVPRIREILMTFYAGDYAVSLRHMANIKRELMLDIHLHRHVDSLFLAIRNRAIIQYFNPYLSADINIMSKAFNVTTDEMENELSRLISDRKICARIDSHNKTIYSRVIDARNTTYTEVFEMGRKYYVTTKALLLRMNMLKQDFIVSASGSKSRRGQSSKFRQIQNFE